MASDPHRTCIGCGRRAPKAELLRLVMEDGEVVADPVAVRPGRGAYVCRNADCVERATKRRGFARAFRRPVKRIAKLTVHLETDE